MLERIRVQPSAERDAEDTCEAEQDVDGHGGVFQIDDRKGEGQLSNITHEGAIGGARHRWLESEKGAFARCVQGMDLKSAPAVKGGGGVECPLTPPKPWTGIIIIPRKHLGIPAVSPPRDYLKAAAFRGGCWGGGGFGRGGRGAWADWRCNSFVRREG